MTETKTRTVTPGSDITWSVSAEGFDTQSGTINDISESQSLDVYLLGSYGTFDSIVKDVETGMGYTTWILLNDGTLWGCGPNWYGQQGSGDTNDVKTFTQRLTDVAQVSASGGTTWAVKTDGTLWGCGRNNFGQQGSGDTTNVLTFTQRMTDVKEVKSCISNSTNSWVLKTDGSLWSCGDNTNNQQGISNTNIVKSFTQRLTDVKEFSPGEYVTWALKTDGTLWGCGNNSKGQQGSGNTSTVTTFTQRLTDVKGFANGWNTTWALKTDGTLWGCGDGDTGQQGSGDTTNVLTFTQRLTDIAQVVCSDVTTWALKTDGTLWGCGSNYEGQQGSGISGSGTNVTTFTQRLTDVSYVTCSDVVTWALKTDGTLWGCGRNNFGQQGSGDTTNVLTFTQRMTNVAKISCFDNVTWVLKTDGTVWGCGNNSDYQQSSGDTNNVLTFTKRNPSVTGYNSATLTINPTPADAVVTINTVETTSTDVRKGTEATWSVSKAGYTTQTGTISHIYDDTTLNITLEAE